MPIDKPNQLDYHSRMDAKTFLSKIGRAGGKSRSKRKVAAARKNIRRELLSRKLCPACGVNRLAPRNETGICRPCTLRKLSHKKRLDKANRLV